MMYYAMFERTDVHRFQFLVARARINTAKAATAATALCAGGSMMDVCARRRRPNKFAGAAALTTHTHTLQELVRGRWFYWSLK